MKMNNNRFLLLLFFTLLLISCSSKQNKPAQFRIGQFLFTEQPVNILIIKKGKTVLDKTLTYKTLTSYTSINSGTYTIKIKQGEKTLLQKEMGFGNQGIYSLILYGIPTTSQKINQTTTSTKLHRIVEGEEATTANGNLPQLKMLNDDFESDQNEVKVRWLHLSPGVSKISAETTNIQENSTTSLSSLTYPQFSKNTALTPNSYKFNWKLEGNYITTTHLQKKLTAENLYTFFVVPTSDHYLTNLQVVVGQTPKKKSK